MGEVDADPAAAGAPAECGVEVAAEADDPLAVDGSDEVLGGHGAGLVDAVLLGAVDDDALLDGATELDELEALDDDEEDELDDEEDDELDEELDELDDDEEDDELEDDEDELEDLGGELGDRGPALVDDCDDDGPVWPVWPGDPGERSPRGLPGSTGGSVGEPVGAGFLSTGTTGTSMPTSLA